jgi:thiamine-monophosphate kinase
LKVAARFTHENITMYLLEDGLIRKIGKATKSAKPEGSLRLGLGDDAALWTPRPGYETIFTCDWFLEGSHFLRHADPPDSVGWKCLARAVSDVAAMGGQPKCFLLGLALPVSHTGRWFGQFLAGLGRAARRFDCQLAGGDTTRRGRILINIAVLGEVRSGGAVLRSGAKAGDLIFVSGRLGEAEFGLRALGRSRTLNRRTIPSVRKHLYPEPRLALGRWLAQKQMATSMMDLSDGLSSDLPRLCAASGVGALIDAGKIPSVKPAKSRRLTASRRLALALNGGDDYELLFTVRPGKAHRLPPRFEGTALTCIGAVTRKRGIEVVEANGGKRSLLPGGWDPFRR